MIKMTKNLNLLLYFVISLFLMEFFLRLDTTKDFLSQGFIISLVFATVLAIIYFIICSFFQKKISYILSSLLLIVTGFIFFSQLIYYNIFKTFYTFYSVGNASQVIEFREQISIVVRENLIWLLLFFIPTLLFLFFGRKILLDIKVSKRYRSLLIASILIFYLIGLGSINIGDKGQNSAYDLYYNNSNPVISVDKLGLITTMRLDIQRLLLDWSPSLNAPAVTAYNPIQNNEIVDSNVEELEVEEIEYNIMDIDFDELISKEDDSIIKEMHNYFSSVEPTAKNDYTGKYEGYNLIHIVAESFSSFSVNEDVTPTLYKMVNEGYNFTNFYVPSWDVSTSDGEYVALQGLLPKKGVWSFSESSNNDLPFVMGHQLKNLGYETIAYHNHSYTYYDRNLSHPNLGYDFKAIGHGLDVREVWPESDLEMMEKSIPEYIDNQPFHTYYLTVSGHMYYSFDGNNMARKNKEYVENLPYSDEAQAYLATQVELDKALEYLLDQLEKADIADKTLIVLSADHYPYGLEEETLDEFLGHKAEENFEIYESNLIIYTEGMDPVTVYKPCSSLDIIPTISNLLGLEYDSRLLMGRDIFSDSDPLIIFNNKSFITDKGNYNSLTKEFIPNKENENKDISEDYINWISSIVDTKFYYSTRILETNYYSKLNF